MENYFNYFTEIEEHFQKRRGKATLLSPLDWSLIESFQESGIPLETVLRGMDRIFERHESQKRKFREINSLAYCTQAILAEYERQKENSVGKSGQPQREKTEDRSERENLMQLIDVACDRLRQALVQLQEKRIASPVEVLETATRSLQDIRSEVGNTEHIDYEHLEMRMSVLEDKILASLISALDDDVLMSLRNAVSQEIGKHRRGLKPEQIAMLEKKMMNKKVMDLFKVPRLSLFYLPLN